MRKILILAVVFCSFQVSADENFIQLAKKTASVFSSVADVDAANPSELSFETLLTNQKAYLVMSATHLNSSFYTLINSDEVSKAKKPKTITPPVINIKNLKILIDNEENPTSTCDGSDLTSTDTSCSGKKCNVTQRVISSCNASDCWKENPSTDRYVQSELSDKFSIGQKIDIYDCIPDNIAGQKHTLKIQVENTSTTILNGGTVQYSLFLQNDVVSVAKKNWSLR